MEKPHYRLLALDLDGTVLDDAKQLTARTAAALTAAAEKGVVIVPATGRTANGIPAELCALPGVRYAILSNGAQVVDLTEHKTLVQRYMPTALALELYDLLRGYRCTVDLFQDGEGYTTDENLHAFDELVPKNLLKYLYKSRKPLADLRGFIAEQEHGIEKMTMFFFDEAERQDAWARASAMGLTPVSSLPRNMELNAPGVTKGSALLALADALNIPHSETMACGDGGNDLPMIRDAGLGVAMANGFDEVKAAANFVTLANTEDGVAYAVEKFILSV